MAGDVFYLYFNETDPRFGDFSYEHSDKVGWLTLNFGMQRLDEMMEAIYANPTVIAPNHNAASEAGEYLDEHEPMMFMSPSRVW